MSYGRNFDFRVLPKSNARKGRFAVSSSALSGAASVRGGSAGTGQIPIGAPVVPDISGGTDATGRQLVKLATQDELAAFDGGSIGTTAVVPGMAGIVVYEFGPAAFAGDDPYLTTYSDKGLVPLGAAVQVISGDPATKVVFTNTVANSFLGIRAYTGRTMVAGTFGSSPVTVGDYLVPGQGDDVDGYWQATQTAAGAWLVITAIDTTRLQVEAEMLF